MTTDVKTIDFLPPTLQINEVYWIMAFCIAVITICRTQPKLANKPGLIELITILLGVVGSIALIGSKSMVYAVFTGVISGALSSTFYTLFMGWAQDKISLLLGVKPPKEPLEPEPQNKTP